MEASPHPAGLTYPVPDRGGWPTRRFRHPSATMWALTLAAVVAVGAGAGLGVRQGVGMLLAMAGLVAVVLRPAIGAIALVGLVPAISGLARGLPLPQARLSEVVIVGVALVVLVGADRREAPPWGAFDWLALAYALGTAGLGAADVVARDDTFNAENVGDLMGPVQFLLLYRATAVALQTTAQCRAALRAALLAGVIVAVLTILQHFDVGGVRSLMIEATGFQFVATAGRATGPFPHWHELGGFLFELMLLSVALWLGGSRRVLPRPALYGVIATCSVALLLTATFAPIFGVLMGGVALAVWYRRLGRVAVWTAVLAVVAVVAFGSVFAARVDQQYHPPPGRGHSGVVPFTIAYRYQVWTDQYIPAVSHRLLTGYGPGVPPEVTWEHTESSYITMLVRGGIPLLLIFLALLVGFAALARVRAGPGDVDRRALARMLVVAAIALIPLQLIAPYLAIVGPPHLLWALAGVLVAWSRARV